MIVECRRTGKTIETDIIRIRVGNDVYNIGELACEDGLSLAPVYHNMVIKPQGSNVVHVMENKK